MSSKPTFLFIPGSWHIPTYFDTLIIKLASDGYESQTVFLPSAGIEPAIESMEPDIQAIVSKLLALLVDGKGVIVVAHSYGGECGSAAVGRIIHEHNDPKKGTGRVLRMVYVSAFVPVDGESHMAMMSAIPNPVGSADYLFPDPPWVSMNEQALEVMCHDVPEPMRQRWRHMIRKHAAATLVTPITRPAWQYVPTTYIYTAFDRAIYLKAQQWLVRRIKSAGIQQFGGMAFDGEAGEFTIESGHMPFLSKTDELARVLATIAQST